MKDLSTVTRPRDRRADGRVIPLQLAIEKVLIGRDDRSGLTAAERIDLTPRRNDCSDGAWRRPPNAIDGSPSRMIYHMRRVSVYPCVNVSKVW